MSVVSEIKCARCDRKYSGVRSRCPYCGARRIGRGKYSEENDNSKGKMLISVMIMAVLVVAVGILVYTSPARENGPDTVLSGNGPLGENGIDTIYNNGENDYPGENGENDYNGEYVPNGDVAPMPPTLENLEIRRYRAGNTPVTLPMSEGIPDVTMRVGESLPLVIVPHPAGVDLSELEIEWTSNNTAAFDVVPVPGDRSRATITATGRSSRSTLTITVDGQEHTMIVRVN